MFSQLNYMESINLAENNITEVQKQAFKEIYLTHINMSHNSISKLENGAFENCVNMTTLDLSYNLIASFSRHTFDELSYATEWLLSFNALTNLSAVTSGATSFWCLFATCVSDSRSFRFVFAGTATQYDRSEDIERVPQSNC